MDSLMTNTREINMNLVEQAYYQMAHTLNTSDSYDEIIEALHNGLKSLIQFINTGIPINNYMVYNIILISKLFVRKNEEKYCYLTSFNVLKTLLNLLTPNEKTEETTPKR